MSDTRPKLIPIDTIVFMLTDRADTLVRELLPLGHRDGHEWREARRAHGGLGDSLSVHLGGSRRGVWAVHGGSREESGDLLDLIAFVRFRGDKKAAIGWAKAWLGLDGPEGLRLAQQAPARREDDGKAAEEAEGRRRAAHGIYLAGAPIGGTPVERYLAARGLDVSRLPYPMNALRFHGALWDRHTKRKWPAMVAAISSTIGGKFLAVHQTYLEVQRDGSVRKAPITDEQGVPAVKRVLGSYRGGTIRLWRGTRIDPETGEIKQARRLADCKAGECVDITEGIEDGLTVALAAPDARVMVAVSISNMASITLPGCVDTVMLWQQNDAPGSKAAAAFQRAVQHFESAGKRVAIWAPPSGIKDVNEWAQKQANGVRVGEAS